MPWQPEQMDSLKNQSGLMSFAMFSKNSCQTPKPNPARKPVTAAVVVLLNLAATAFLAGCNYETPALLYASLTVTASPSPVPTNTSIPSWTQVPSETGTQAAAFG